MRVVRSEVLGFCMGVRRAVSLAEDAAARCAAAGKKIYTLGPLIHNSAALEELGAKGISVLDGSCRAALDGTCTVIIRAHGAPPGVVSAIGGAGAEVVDATCPRVTLSQTKAREYAARGYCVIIAGDALHAEVQSIASFAPGSSRVIGSAREAALFSPPARSILLSQTTFGREEADSIARILKERCPSLEVFDSICPETLLRQNALRALAGKASGVIVIGGRDSANTKRLFSLSKELFPNHCMIERAADIPEAFFRMDSVALCSGASTPDFVIDAVERALKAGGV